MKKLIATCALVGSHLLSNGQQVSLKSQGYIDLSASSKRNVSQYQYSRSGINHAIGGVIGNVGERVSFRALGQFGNYVESNYIGTDGDNIKYIHDLNLSVKLGDDNYIKIEGGVLGGSPIGQPSIIPITVQSNIESSGIPTNIITNSLLNTRTQLSENTPYYITGLFVSKHQGNRDIKVGVTNGAQHIKDNNNKLGGFGSMQYSFKDNTSFYACYHLSDESTDLKNKLMHHIREGHGIVTIGELTLIPAIYYVKNENLSLSGVNITTAQSINKTTKISGMIEQNYNPDTGVFGSNKHSRGVVELQKILGNNENSSTVITGAAGIEKNGAQVQPTFGLSFKTIFLQK